MQLHNDEIQLIPIFDSFKFTYKDQAQQSSFSTQSTKCTAPAT